MRKGGKKGGERGLVSGGGKGGERGVVSGRGKKCSIDLGRQRAVENEGLGLRLSDVIAKPETAGSTQAMYAWRICYEE
jgi:hypothetical protein